MTASAAALDAAAAAAPMRLWMKSASAQFAGNAMNLSVDVLDVALLMAGGTDVTAEAGPLAGDIVKDGFGSLLCFLSSALS